MVEKRGGLGKGIGALIPSGEKDAVDVFFTSEQKTTLLPVPGAAFANIPVGQIQPNPQQPRDVFEPEAFQELVHSVKEFGVLQPIVVRPDGDNFQLIMGERRWRASKEAGLAEIPAIIRETTDENMLRDALLENLHRSDLNPLEEAAAYKQLLEDFGITQEQLADRLGRSRPQITNTLRLMRLPVVVQEKLVSGVLSSGHARALLSIENEAQVIELAEKAIKKGLSVRALEELISVTKGKKPKASVTPGTTGGALTELEERLQERLSTSVSIKLGKKRGQLVIDFANFADLKRIIDEIDG
ncbi:MAG: ParB/RepB/Spo0J family partition protein [Microbacteriaceae bacterium]|nr:ParB/RepB/Spo0J family partition protein [Microbacteriaceae bacterium]MDR9444256.1 ParB/RepB/Spo0J family partition protein [Microbacteriaceae bacterium]